MPERNILEQYYDLRQEEIEVAEKIRRLEADIIRIDSRIQEIECGETSIDSVRGGYGGTQHFVIEGIPLPEYRDKRNRLFMNRVTLEKRIERQRELHYRLMETVGDVEKFIESVDDSHVRRIMRYRFEQHLPWREVADRIGGGNTEDSVKKAYYRYIGG